MSGSPADYKKLKEDFVSNLSGGTVLEVVYVTAVLPVSILLWSVLQARQSFFRNYTTIAFVVDFLLNIGAPLLSVTLYAKEPLLLSLLLLVPAVFVWSLPTNAYERRKKPRLPPTTAQSKQGVASGPLDTLSRKPFLTSYRGGMIALTCIAILAVDFRLFPRRFAKVETWGTSLMDMGVGSFVFSAGVVAARPVLKERAERRPTPMGRRILLSLRHSLPLFVLGVVRTLSVKGLDYAEHVTEYGVHWNFFFTLGLLPPFVAAFQSALRIIPSFAALAILLGVVYQVALETTPLKAFIIAAPRTGFFSMNREGIFSFLGYLAIFLAGQDTGMYILPRSLTRTGSSKGTQRNTLLLTMTVWSAVWSALYFFSTSYRFGFGWTVSRRLANLPYVLWVAGFNTMQLLACCIVDTIFFPAFYNATNAKTEAEAYEVATSRVMRALNRNGLAVFLVANVLTGVVNMKVRTLDVDATTTMAILVSYMAAVCGFAVGLDSLNISIKF